MTGNRIVVFAIATLIATDVFGHDDQPHHAIGSHDRSWAGETAYGRAADPATVNRTIVVEMRDSFEFSPSNITVRVGEIVRFVPTNAGQHAHEMVLGTLKELGEHYQAMHSNPGMRHDEPNMARVAPGKSGVIVWQFTRPGEFYFACLVDDHFDAGMMGKIRVAGEPMSEGTHQGHAHGEAQPHPHSSEGMQGVYGPYPMARESSATSWQPDSSPHGGIDAAFGDWMTMTHGFVNLVYDHQGGPRGDTKTFSSSMLMTMAQRPLGDGTLGLRGMISADPLMGKDGYPLLLQTGETADGQTLLVDRQHPHDLFTELAATYSRRVSERGSAFAYVGLPGEPALGPPAFMHRFSGEDNPEAPISHHWLDSTHISFGVVTLGVVLGGLKLETSIFRGREPDQFRYNVETGKLDSASIRLSYNPTEDWALQMSRGHIKSPEALEPEVEVDRTTASAIYNRRLAASNWQTTLAWGRNAKTGHDATDAYLLESAIAFSGAHTFFGRVERSDKDELFPAAPPLADETFRVGKLTLGYVHDFPIARHFKIGVGGLVSRYALDGALDSSYGNPTSYMLFARLKIN
jgi:uncharacterized cupredoxin-like copper-binding protein